MTNSRRVVNNILGRKINRDCRSRNRLYNMKCVVCNGTGKNKKGGRCWNCWGKGVKLVTDEEDARDVFLGASTIDGEEEKAEKIKEGKKWWIPSFMPRYKG